MLRKISLLVVFAVFGLALVGFAGCGDDDKESSAPAATSEPSEEATATEEDSGDSEDADSTPTSTGNAEADEAIKAAVESCKSSIDAQTTLSEDVKTDLKGICDKAGSGKIDDVQAATKEVCTKIVEDQVPAGAARDQALAACDQAGG
jgi:hypothetical protein